MEDSNPWIKTVSVRNLHDQYDIDQLFFAGTNILYGLNGRGKTTLLHIIANALEGDFRRFLYIRFSNIRITSNTGSELLIRQDRSGDTISITSILNGVELPSVDVETSLSHDYKKTIAASFGGAPVYLPAFRSILERTSKESLVRHDLEKDQMDEFSAIVKQEQVSRRALRTSDNPQSRYYPDRHDRQAESVAYKTIQCRKWFGKSVPTIRYPSLSEVEDRLNEEIRMAQIMLARLEEGIFSEMFVNVIELILKPTDDAGFTNTPTLLATLSNTMSKLQSNNTESGSIFTRIQNIVNQYADMGTERELATRILSLYISVMDNRIDYQQKSYENIRRFSESVNTFLNDKELLFHESWARRTFLPSLVYIKSKFNNKPIGLNSLSSGERQIVTMLFSATRMASGSSVFLIDEPEISLHIDWQRCIISEIEKHATGKQIIACTHSPEVGADHFGRVTIFTPRQSAKQEQNTINDENDVGDDEAGGEE